MIVNYLGNTPKTRCPACHKTYSVNRKLINHIEKCEKKFGFNTELSQYMVPEIQQFIKKGK